MEKGSFRRGPVVGLAAVILAVLIAQIALAGAGEPEGTISISKSELKELIREEVAKHATAEAAKKKKKKKKKKTKRGPAGQQGPQGVQGPAGTAPACQGNGSGDTMVSAGAVCIDKYEASIWDAPTGGTQITGAIPCNANGQDCTNIYARSVPGVTPSRFITWFQAQQALANSGKRLPTNAEWQQAVAGTPDPGTDNGTTDCNVGSTFAVANTGSRSSCVSNHGAFDMVGNLFEWVGDWDEEASACANWPAGYGTDSTCLGRGSGEASTRFPGAMARGGFFSDGAAAGPFSVFVEFRPSTSFFAFGFRGAR